MLLEGDQPLCLGQPENRIHQRQKLGIALLAVGRAFDQLAGRFEKTEDHPFRIALQIGAYGGAKDDEKFERLKKNGEAAVRGVTTGDGAECYDDANKPKHSSSAVPKTVDMKLSADCAAKMVNKACVILAAF